MGHYVLWLKIGDYSKAKPYYDRIEKINRLYEQDKIIFIWSARGMNRFNGDIKKVHEIFYDLTLEQLKEWGVKYHYFELGKLSYDLFICDKAINDKDFFED